MFKNFSPLSIKESSAPDESIYMRRNKRSIHSILHSYVGWYDPFAELIQNALDSVERNITTPETTNIINIIIDEEANRLTVSDNGIGLDKEAFHKFLAPHESFKNEGERGSKGVGATYLAYGFNYIRVDTKTKHFAECGEMEGALDWLHDLNASSEPNIYSTEEDHIDIDFSTFKTGVSITIHFDKNSKPSKLEWPGLKSAEIWHMALSVKTALGAVNYKTNVNIKVTHISKTGEIDEHCSTETGYLCPHEHVKKQRPYEDVINIISKNIDKKGASAKLPLKVKNLDAVSIDWDCQSIITNVTRLSDDQKKFCNKHNVRIKVSFMSGAKVWKRFAESKFHYRSTAKVYDAGIQLAADNMPQGDLIQIPLQRYTGRQNQVHVVIHFENCVVDLGRKGFDKDFVDFAKFISRYIVEDNFTKIRDCLRNEDVKKKSLLKGDKVNNWKKSLEDHENTFPLKLKNEYFFVPINEISISAEPTREQDVIALFNQLVAGGVIRGVKIVGTNEMSTYDGAYRIRIGPKYENHIYDKSSNPLGISEEEVEDYKEDNADGFISSKLNILEYKYSLDGLIIDITTGDKQAAEIDLVIAWESGTDYKKLYDLTSLLNIEGPEVRNYHGITHILADEHGNHVMDVILLSDLIGFLNDPEKELKKQNIYEE